MAAYSRSSKQNFDNWRFWIRNNKRIVNFIKEQDDIDKIYSYAKDLSGPKYEFLNKKREHAGTKHLNDSNAFFEYSNKMDDIYENIDEYNPNKQRKILIVFDDLTADIMKDKKFQAIVKESFSRCRKLHISLMFITRSHFSVPKYVRSNSNII